MRNTHTDYALQYTVMSCIVRLYLNTHSKYAQLIHVPYFTITYSRLAPKMHLGYYQKYDEHSTRLRMFFGGAPVQTDTHEFSVYSACGAETYLLTDQRKCVYSTYEL